jgi:hypothetical protein
MTDIFIRWVRIGEYFRALTIRQYVRALSFSLCPYRRYSAHRDLSTSVIFIRHLTTASGGNHAHVLAIEAL